MKIRRIHLIEAVVVVAALSILSAVMIPKFLDAQNINMAENFPDPVFRSVIEEFMGVEPGGDFSHSEAIRKNGIIEYNRQTHRSTKPLLQDIKGIELFPNITEIVCPGAQKLSTVDLSKNRKLRRINFTHSGIKQLILGHKPALEELFCNGNSLSELDLSSCPNLKKLICSFNAIRQLDVSHSPYLEHLDCTENQIVSLELSNLKELLNLHCSRNPLTALVLTNNINLLSLQGYNLFLNSIDVSNNPQLRLLNLSDNSMTELDVSNNPKLESIYISNNQLTRIPDFSALQNLRYVFMENNLLGPDDNDDIERILEWLGPYSTIPGSLNNSGFKYE